MSKLKSYIEDWLDEGGHSLGFSMGCLPEMQDMDWITRDKIDAEMYFRLPEYRRFKREFIKLTGGK